jgi:hypothetical protein
MRERIYCSAVLRTRLTIWHLDPLLEINNPNSILFFIEQRDALSSVKVNLAANQRQAAEGLSLWGLRC